MEDTPGLLSAELGSEEFAWLSQSCEPAGPRAEETLVAAGDSADPLPILLRGELRAAPRSGEPCRFLRRPREPLLLVGAIFLKNLEAASDCRLLRVGADDYLQRVASQSPASGLILSGLIWRFRTTEAILHQSEQLASLGKLAAGLTHELNNPAAADKRAASQVRSKLRRLYRIAVRLGELDLDADHPRTLLRFSAEDRRARLNPSLDPVSRADAQEAVGRWLTVHQIGDAWDLAPRVVEAGMSPAHLADFTDGLAPEAVSDALNWVGGVFSVEELITTLGKDTRHSAGLGLDIVYSIVVRRSSGSIQVRSTPGDTRFRVLLPLIPASPGELDDMKLVRIERDSA